MFPIWFPLALPAECYTFVDGCRTRDTLISKKEAPAGLLYRIRVVERPRMQLGTVHGVSFATVLWYFQMTGKWVMV